MVDSCSPLINKLSWNGLKIYIEIHGKDVSGGTFVELCYQTFLNWEDLAIKDWKIPASSKYPSLSEILKELYDPSYGEFPIVVLDLSGKLLWESRPGIARNNSIIFH